jgi:hypothetical protein
MLMDKQPLLNGKAQVHYRKESVTEQVESLPTKRLEQSQINDVNIIRTRPPTQEFMPLGYNREAILDRVARGDFWNFNVALNPAHVEEYSPTGHIDFEGFARSVTKMYGTNTNMFVWDQLPELENLPVAGHPEETQQQYVLYNVKPSWKDKAEKTLHIHKQSAPTAYGAYTDTSKQESVVYQTPVSAIKEMLTASGPFQALKTWLVGS